MAEEGKSTNLSCPHCSKRFKQELGLNYHIKNFVCRPQLKPSAKADFKPKKRERPDVVPSRDSSAAREEETISGESTSSENDDQGDDDSSSSVSSLPRKRSCRVTTRKLLPNRKRSKIAAIARSKPSVENEDVGDEMESATDSESDERSRKADSNIDKISPFKRRRAIAPSLSVVNQHSEDLRCPHCHKAFKIASGCRYHVDNYVCRQELRPGGPVKRGKRKASDNKKSDYKKIRGRLADRICPKCERVFTSTLGLKYHVDKNVCENNKKTVNMAEIGPFPSLKAGLQFATKFGVVEVIADDRVTPSALNIIDYKQQLKKYSYAKSQYEKRLQNFYLASTIKHLEQRSHLMEFFLRGDLSQRTVFEASLGVDHPSIFSSSRQYPPLVIPPSPPKDPAEPEGSFPDRIVECVVIRDRRERFRGDNENEPKEMGASGMIGCKMFLQRRLLTIPYLEQQSLFECVNCGQEFASRAGVKYHTQSKVCFLKAENALKVYKARMQSLSERHLADGCDDDSYKTFKRLNKRPASWYPNTNSLLPEAPAPIRIFRRKKEKNVANVSVYPQVYLALGIKLMPRSIVPVKRSTVSAFKKKPVDAANEVQSQATDEDGMADVALSSNITTASQVTKEILKTQAQKQTLNPRATLAELEKKLKLEQGKQLGSVYQFAFKALGFKKARSKKKKKITKKTRESSATKDLTTQLLAIDTSVLVDEVEAGRYPSMKRNSSEVIHETHCYICKSDTDRSKFRCQFCTHTIHRKCMLTRYIVKEPELDDFMCSDCISYIHHRRKRAEKRRLEKLGLSEPTHENDQLNDTALMTTLIPGREYDCLLAQGQRVAELAEMLESARMRLCQTLEVAKLDHFRMACIEPTEQQDQCSHDLGESSCI